MSDWAIITGGSRGIGAAIARVLARDGMHVVVNWHSRADAAEATIAGIQHAGGSAESCAFDVADRAAAHGAIAGLLARLGAPYAVVHNAGIRRDGLMVFSKPEDHELVLATNLLSFFTVVQPFLKPMLAARRGRIVAMSSTAGQLGNAGQVSYAAAKAGLVGAVRSLAKEVGRRGITVNAIAPGFVATDMTADLPAAELQETIPIARFGTPDEVAAVVQFLLRPEAGYVTGQVLGVNGGIAQGLTCSEVAMGSLRTAEHRAAAADFVLPGQVVQQVGGQGLQSPPRS